MGVVSSRHRLTPIRKQSTLIPLVANTNNHHIAPSPDDGIRPKSDSVALGPLRISSMPVATNLNSTIDGPDDSWLRGPTCSVIENKLLGSAPHHSPWATHDTSTATPSGGTSPKTPVPLNSVIQCAPSAETVKLSPSVNGRLRISPPDPHDSEGDDLFVLSRPNGSTDLYAPCNGDTSLSADEMDLPIFEVDEVNLAPPNTSCDEESVTTGSCSNLFSSSASIPNHFTSPSLLSLPGSSLLSDSASGSSPSNSELYTDESAGFIRPGPICFKPTVSHFASSPPRLNGLANGARHPDQNTISSPSIAPVVTPRRLTDRLGVVQLSSPKTPYSSSSRHDPPWNRRFPSPSSSSATFKSPNSTVRPSPANPVTLKCPLPSTHNGGLETTAISRSAVAPQLPGRPTYPFGRDCRFLFQLPLDSEEEEEQLHNRSSPVTSPANLAIKRRLERDLWLKRADRIGRFLETRPTSDDLIEKNILPSITPEQRAEMRIEIEATLERRLSQRPTVGELEQKNILYTETEEMRMKAKEEKKRLLTRKLSTRPTVKELQQRRIIRFNDYVEITEADVYDRRADKPWTRLTPRDKSVAAKAS
ncbi:unnamed protein product [Dicrocoelium dendriticum]|nr:unnamed protein product [Dicrocoelium dendriticum]